MVTPRRPSPGAALFVAPQLHLVRCERVHQVPVALGALVHLPGHHVFVAEQPPQEGQLRVAALLYAFFISRMVFCR